MFMLGHNCIVRVGHICKVWMDTSAVYRWDKFARSGGWVTSAESGWDTSVVFSWDTSTVSRWNTDTLLVQCPGGTHLQYRGGIYLLYSVQVKHTCRVRGTYLQCPGGIHLHCYVWWIRRIPLQSPDRTGLQRETSAESMIELSRSPYGISAVSSGTRPPIC
jgi:hypothetical protein